MYIYTELIYYTLLYIIYIIQYIHFILYNNIQYGIIYKFSETKSFKNVVEIRG